MDAATLVRHALDALRRPLTLKEALSSVADFRIDRKKKYPLYEILMVAVCAMIDGAKGPTFGVASLRSVSAAVSPDERSEESPKAMSIRGASSNSASSGKRTGALSPLVAGCWLLEHFGRRPSQSLHGRVRRVQQEHREDEARFARSIPVFSNQQSAFSKERRRRRRLAAGGWLLHC